MLNSEQTRWFYAEVKPLEPLLRGYLQKRFPAVADHDDIIQETYARVLNAQTSGRLTFVKGFLFVAARNIAIDLIRAGRKRVHEPIGEQLVLDSVSDVRAAVEHKQRHDVLIEALASLPERCREVMILRYVEGMSYKEIGERLGISPGTVKAHRIKGVRDCTGFFRSRGLLGAESTLAFDPSTTDSQ